MSSQFLANRFRWGINIDDPWRYAGLPSPKSVIIPYVLSVHLPRGQFKLPFGNIDDPQDGGGSAEQNSVELCKQTARNFKNAGIEFVRCWFPWNFFEPKISKESLSSMQYPMDDFVSAMNGAGVKILAVVGNGYSRFLPAGLNMENPIEYNERLSLASRQIVRHYASQIDHWQIENEPNWWDEHAAMSWRKGGLWFQPGIQESLLSVLNDIVRSEAPQATVVVNLEADRKNTDWKMYSKYCDVMGLDFYPNYSHSTPIDASELKIASEIGNIAGKPVFVAETGYPSGPSILGYSEQHQAEYVKQACEESFTTDRINGICFWRYSDTYWKSFPPQENHFGLLKEDGTEKQAWNQFVSSTKNH